MFIAGHKIIVVVAHFIVIIHGSKLKHLLKTVPNHAFCLCLQTDTSVHRLTNVH